MDERFERFRRHAVEAGLERMLRTAVSGMGARVKQSCEEAYSTISQKGFPLSDEERAQWARIFMAIAEKKGRSALDEADGRLYDEVVTPRVRHVGELRIDGRPAGLVLLYERYWVIRVTAPDTAAGFSPNPGLMWGCSAAGREYVILSSGGSAGEIEMRLRPSPPEQFPELKIGHQPGYWFVASVTWIA